jgi:hypothetical protein
VNKLKFLISAATLTFALAVPAAGEALICKPGETQTPPCSSASAMSGDPAAVPGQTETSDVQSVEIASLVELALYALLLA